MVTLYASGARGEEEFFSAPHLARHSRFAFASLSPLFTQKITPVLQARASDILVGATENWNVLAHWVTGFHFFFPPCIHSQRWDTIKIPSPKSKIYPNWPGPHQRQKSVYFQIRFRGKINNTPNRLTQCRTQLKPFGNKSFCSRYFHIIEMWMLQYNANTIPKES